MASRYKGDRRSAGRGTDRRRERRRGARLDARIELSPAFFDSGADARGAEPLSLYGHTRDLSAAGVGIVIPLVSFDPRSCSVGLPLRVRLDLPSGQVEVEAEAVHCEPLGGHEPVDGFLVGAKLRGEGAALALLAAGVPPGA